VLTVVATLEVSMADFNGITEYHDGLAVSDYLNMIPLGKTCIDRVGDLVVRPPFSTNNFKIRGVFVDSHHNIYIAFGPMLVRYKYDEFTDSITGEAEVMKMFYDGGLHDFTFKNTTHRVTFCESSLKPSEVFACDGNYVYFWATYEGLSDPHYQQFRVNVMCPPNITKTEETDKGIVQFWTGDVPPDFNSLLFGEDEASAEGVALKSYADAVVVDAIDWFDNRLVGTQITKNTVWLTRTDPMYFIRDVNLGIDYLDASNPDTGGYELWANWYSSSANSDKLLTVKAYGGQLYFFNEHTIEIWGRTGNEDAPIQSNTQQVLHFGGELPTIIEGVLYFVGIDSMNDRFIGAFSPQFSRISNKEIERRLNKVVSLEKISQYNETYLFVKHEDNDGFVFGDGKWWRWESPKNADYKIYCSVIREFAIADTTAMVRFDQTRRISGGKRLPRGVRDGFVMLPKRAIIRRVELVADTGRTDLKSSLNVDGTPNEVMQSKAVYCSVSTNRGLSFSQRRYRDLGDDGRNNKVIEWRNLGSGNSFLVEIGTSSLHRLQIYDIKVDFG